MNWEDAGKMFSTGPVHHTMEDIRAWLESVHVGHPQRLMMAQMALDDIEHAIARLASLGHSFSLVQTQASDPLMFPKMMYKTGEAPMEVDSSDSLASAKAEGWVEHPSEAMPNTASMIEPQAAS